PLFQKRGNHLWRMLQIGVHHDDDFTGGMLKSRGESRLVSEIACKGDVAYAWISTPQFLDNAQRAVPRTIVDIDDFNCVLVGEPGQAAREMGMEVGKSLRFFKGRTDDAQLCHLGLCAAFASGARPPTLPCSTRCLATWPIGKALQW